MRDLVIICNSAKCSLQQIPFESYVQIQTVIYGRLLTVEQRAVFSSTTVSENIILYFIILQFFLESTDMKKCRRIGII
jgi:hypothetical protein